MTEGIHYSKELEFGVLGICLIEKTAMGRVYGTVDEKTFYYSDNQAVYRCLLQMYNQNIPIDNITVWQKIMEDGIKMNAGETPGDIAYYLTRLSNHVVCSSHVEYHCFLLKNMWRKRELDRITRSGISDSDDVRKQITELTDSLNQIRGSEFKQDWYDMSEMMYNLTVHQQQIKDGGLNLLTTGFSAIDRLNGGFAAGQLVIIGARPSVGKSALMGKMALAMADKGHKVGVISLEMNNTDIAARLASLETDMPFNTIYRNLFADEREHERFYNIISNQSIKKTVYVSDKTKVDVNEIKAKAAKLKHQYGCDCLMVDYLQLVDTVTQNKNYSRENEVSKISRGLKLLAMEMEMPIVVLCQLNRAVTGRSEKDRYPKLSDLRESGAIEQDADIVMMVHRDWTIGKEEDENGETTKDQADLLGLKWRNGETFHLKLDFDGPKMKFMEKGRSASTWVPVNNSNHEDNPF